MRAGKPVLLVVMVAVVLLMAVASAQQKRQQEIDLQAAIRTETVDGDLNSAIRQFGAIAAKYKGDHAIAATALVRMAQCYEKLGDTEAHKIYQQILREYADQADAAAIARRRLAGSTIQSAQPLRRLPGGSYGLARTRYSVRPHPTGGSSRSTRAEISHYATSPTARPGA